MRAAPFCSAPSTWFASRNVSVGSRVPVLPVAQQIAPQRQILPTSLDRRNIHDASHANANRALTHLRRIR